MRIRVLRLIASAYGVFTPGVVVDVPVKVGRDWCNTGMAMQDKSLDGGRERKRRREKKHAI